MKKQDTRATGQTEQPMMPAIKRGMFHAYYIYDVSNTIDLGKLSRFDANQTEPNQLALSPVSSPYKYLHFVTPPLSAKLEHTEVGSLKALVRITIYDYGTISIRTTFEMDGNYEQVLALTVKLRQSAELAGRAEAILNEVVNKLQGTLNQPHKPLLEEYYVVEVNEFETETNSSELIEKYGTALACLLQNESRPLTALEQEDSLKVRFSYFDSDLILINWDCAFVFESRESAESVESILEFANTQLVELRTYDARLDKELDEIYKWDVTRFQQHWLFGRRTAEERVARIRKLLVDIRELSDRSNNALKIIGDAYYARLYRSAASRLGISDWQKQLESKLDNVNEIYRYAVDQAQHSRSDFLELVIIVLIVIEIILSLRGTGH